MSKMVATFVHLFLRIIDKIFKKLYITAIYETKTGIKRINNLRVEPIRYFKEGNGVQFIDPTNLCLGPDNLNDNYTLLDVRIKESPHYKLMVALMNDEDVLGNEYIKRSFTGCLDGRRAMPANQKALLRYKERFRKSVQEIKNNKYPPIVIYEMHNNRYILDGKHRASLCCLLNKKVRCITVQNSFLSGNHQQMIISRMKRSKLNYSKHLSFFDKFFDKNRVIRI